MTEPPTVIPATGKSSEGTGNKSISGHHPNCSTDKIGQNAEKILGDLMM